MLLLVLLYLPSTLKRTSLKGFWNDTIQRHTQTVRPMTDTRSERRGTIVRQTMVTLDARRKLASEGVAFPDMEFYIMIS